METTFIMVFASICAVGVVMLPFWYDHISGKELKGSVDKNNQDINSLKKVNINYTMLVLDMELFLQYPNPQNSLEHMGNIEAENIYVTLSQADNHIVLKINPNVVVETEHVQNSDDLFRQEVERHVVDASDDCILYNSSTFVQISRNGRIDSNKAIDIQVHHIMNIPKVNGFRLARFDLSHDAESFVLEDLSYPQDEIIKVKFEKIFKKDSKVIFKGRLLPLD